MVAVNEENLSGFRDEEDLLEEAEALFLEECFVERGDVSFDEALE